MRSDLPSQSTILEFHVASRRGLLALGLFTAGSPPGRQPSSGSSFQLSVNGPTPAMMTRPSLVVAGPENGRLMPWVRLTADAINSLLPAGPSLHIINVGGEDGVTAANQFEAKTALNGETALLVSGETAIAWLVGDPRAQFDIGKWVPVATGTSSGVVLAKPSGIDRNTPIRLASNATRDHNLTAKLGLSLLGIETAQIITAHDPVSIMHAGRADAVFLIGADASRAARLAIASNATGIFSLGAYDEAGALIRDPALPMTPTLAEQMARQVQTVESHNLLRGWSAVAAAARLEFALILPTLSPAGTVAWWRKVGAQMGSAQNNTVRVDIKTPNRTGFANIIIDADTSLSLRSWTALHNG